MIKCVKLKVIKPVDCDWKVFGKVLRDLQDETYRTCNKSSQLCWEYHNFSKSYKEKTGSYPNLKTDGILGFAKKGGLSTSTQQYCYTALFNENTKSNSQNIEISIKNVTDKYKPSAKPESYFMQLLKGEARPVGYKKDIPIDIRNTALHIFKNDNNYYADLSLISIPYRKTIERASCKFCVQVNVSKNYQKAIIDRILNNEYILKSSKLVNDDKDWYLNIVYDFPKQNSLVLDKNNILGIDMGIVNAVYAAVNTTGNGFKIVGGEVQAFRDRIYKLRNSYYSQATVCGDGRRGHGKKTLLKPLRKLRKKESDYSKLINFRYAKKIVDFAIKNNCGVIQLEDLSGISKKEKKTRVLKDWTYYDLKVKITNLASEHDIDVVIIDPKFTSQRCHKCGHIDKNNRPTQDKFICNSCGHFGNADYNAARNIATKDIDVIIENKLLELGYITPEELTKKKNKKLKKAS